MVQKLHRQYGATRLPNNRGTPQNRAIPGREDEMVENNAGGVVFTLDPLKQLQRFLILGTEGGSFYAEEAKMTQDNASVIMRMLKAGRGVEVVDALADVSTKGKAYKQAPTLYALALAFAYGDAATKARCKEVFNSVVRIGTHLFTFLEYVTSMRGWGRNLRAAVLAWYQDQELQRLATQVTKYGQREGWSHRDVLRLVHPKPRNPDENALYGYVVDSGKHRTWQDMAGDAFEYLRAIEKLHQTGTSIPEAVDLIKRFRLPREVVPTQMLNSVEIWAALLPGMPVTAMIRNLGKMTSVELLKPLAAIVDTVVQRITDPEILRKGRVHPIQLLAALKTYELGHGIKGSLTWSPVAAITDALDKAFYLSFENVVPTDKKIVVGIDVSGSMGGGEIGGVPGLTPCAGAAAMSMMIARTEKQYVINGFTSGNDGPVRFYADSRNAGTNGFVDLGFTSRLSLKEAMDRAIKNNYGATDCALPMVWATERKIDADAFVILTDNETWAGNIQPTEALRNFRRVMQKPDACLAVIAMTSTGFTIADPKDPRQMDFVGFSTDTPRVMADFIRGDV